MTTMAINNLWRFLQSLSMTANNKRWLAQRLLESAEISKTATSVDKQAAFEKSFGVWKNDPDADLMERVIKEGRTAVSTRNIVSFDD